MPKISDLQIPWPPPPSVIPRDFSLENAIKKLIERWRKDAAQYQLQVDEARKKNLPHEQTLSMTICLKVPKN